MRTGTPKSPRLLLFLTALLVVAGCSRAHYRRQADDEVAVTLAQKGGYFDHGPVDPRPDSRLFDPYDPDEPPMPPDDPRSHVFMHRVDGMDGWDGWHDTGSVPSVDAETWHTSLPRGADGTVTLSLPDAVRVARVNSRQFQDSLETLYFSALDVTLERFRFDHQFAADSFTEALFRGQERVPPSGSSTLSQTTTGAVRKLSATGGELFLGLANSIVYEFTGPNSELVRSTFDFSLVQPLLRYGGRARVLEQLTQSERTLLANVRQMEQFRRGFYVEIAAGRNPGAGPARRGAIGQGGLGLLAGTPSGRNGAPSPGGYIGLIQEQQEIQNKVAVIAALKDSLAQLEAAFDANRISSRLQVDQARQALLNAQSSLLTDRAGYATRVDGFKIDLGLPPDLPVVIQDPLLEQFTLIDPALTVLQGDLDELLYEIRRQRDEPTMAGLKSSAGKLVELHPRFTARLDSALSDFGDLEPRIPERLEQLRKVRLQVELTQANVDPRIYDEQRLLQRLSYLERRLPDLAAEMTQQLSEVARPEQLADDGDAQIVWDQLSRDATRLSDLLLELSLLQAETRLQGVSLVPLEMEPEPAIETARLNRLDWMNARANLVDAWRQIEVDANDLESQVDIVVRGQLRTKGDNPVEFHTDGGEIRLGLEVDTPVTRLVERNQYRETLINYQRARRDYMLFEDQVKQSVRNTLRIIELSRINFEVRRTAVQVAIAQVDIARLKLNPPVRPGQNATQTSPTAARDLVSALSDLLDSQNDFLNVWVNYEVLRVLLDFELGTMQIDESGLWIDPGEINMSSAPATELTLPLPPPPAPALVAPLTQEEPESE